jgi:RNA polymerase-binding protein DksA
MSRFDERMREKIESELISLNRWIAALSHESWAEDVEMGGDNTPLSDEADSAEISEQQEIRFEMLERLVAKAKRLDEALHRFPEGIYGLCTSCGKPIHSERLEALPEAAFCLRCQKQQERAQQVAEARAAEMLGPALLFRHRIRG